MLARDGHDYQTQLYDSLHDSEMQRKFRRLCPMPFGVVFLPWAGMTEDDMRQHFRWMKELGFTKLKQTMGTYVSPYACDGAIVYRLAAPEAGHYFFINDDQAGRVTLDTKDLAYESVSDPVNGEQLTLGAPIDLEAYSARWLRLAR